MLARARGFHGRVQGQDVGLEGDAIDHADDVGDLARAGVDGAHGFDHLAHDRATAFGHHRGLVGQLSGLGRVAGGLLHTGAELLHRGGGFLQARGLLLGAQRQVLVAHGDLGRGVRDGFGRGAHLRDHAAQALVHADDSGHEVAELVPALSVELAVESTSGDVGGGLQHITQRTGDAAQNEPAGGRAHGHANGQQHGDAREHLGGRSLRGLLDRKSVV